MSFGLMSVFSKNDTVCTDVIYVVRNADSVVRGYQMQVLPFAFMVLGAAVLEYHEMFYRLHACLFDAKQ